MGKTFPQIAEELGVHPATVERAFKSGITKLRRRGYGELIIACLHAVVDEEKDIIQAGSIECSPEWINENSFDEGDI